MSAVPPVLSTDDLRDLLGAYALDAVDDVERRAVERFVAQDKDAAAELALLRATAAELGAAVASSAADLPPALRTAILAEVARTPQDSRAPEEGGSPEEGHTPQDDTGLNWSGRRRRDAGSRRLLSLALAAAALVAVAVPSTLAWQEHGRAVQAEQRAGLLSDVLADPGAQLIRGAVTGGGEAVAVLTDERALLVVDGLTRLDADKTYQLWAMRDGVPVPAGLLGPRGGTVQVLAADYRPGDGLAVSVEPEGGSDQPTTTPVVVLIPT